MLPNVWLRLTKWASGLMVGLSGRLPDSWEWLFYAAVLLFLADTVTGYWLAARLQRVSSHTMREKTVSKALQYCVLFLIGWLAHQIAGDQEWIVAAAIGLIAYVELLSNIENLAALEKCGGVSVGPFKPFLDRVARYLEPSITEPERKGDKNGNGTANAAAVPANKEHVR